MKDDDGAKYPMVAVDDALALVLENTAPLQTERVPLLENGTAPALRRCLAERIEAAAPFPQFRAAISDGYCCAATNKEQALSDDGAKQLAGTAATPLREGACRYITTGAPLPEGADAVAKQEHCARNGAEVSLPALKPGADVREIGSDWSQGDELCSKATPLTPSDVAILAAAGQDVVEVYRRPRVRVFSSGAELHVDGPFDATRQIKDANRAGLIALLSDGSSFGGNSIVEDGGVLPDDLDAWNEALGDALSTCDVVVTTGGASVGRADFAKKALEGASRSVVRFGRLHMKPGKPTTFATLDSRSFLDDVEGEKRWAFALPGNPVSALTTASLLVVPCLKRLQGVARSSCGPAELPVTLSSPVSLDAVRPEFHRVALSLRGGDENAEPYRVRHSGEIVAASTGVQRSSRLLSMRGAHALACLPERGRANLVAPGATAALPAGTTVPGLLIAAPPPLVAGAPFLSSACGFEATTPPPPPPIDGVVVAVAIVGGEEPADAQAAAATAAAEIVAAATGLRATTRPPIRDGSALEAVARDAAVVVACGGLGLAPREPNISKALAAHRRAPGLARAMALASGDAIEAPAAAIVGNALVLVVPEASAAACVRSVAKALPAIVNQLPAVKDDSVVEHAGGCHCKAVRFRVRAPRHLVAWDCNCSICHMKKNTHFIVPASDFFLDEGEENLSEYRFGTGVARHRFCRTCGVQAFYHPRSNPDGVAITVACLDQGSVSSVEVRKFDGQDWSGSYAATGIAACSKK
jgi:gephyrin